MKSKGLEQVNEEITNTLVAAMSEVNKIHCLKSIKSLAENIRKIKENLVMSLKLFDWEMKNLVKEQREKIDIYKHKLMEC